jgi:hypothetical protein
VLKVNAKKCTFISAPMVMTSSEDTDLGSFDELMNDPAMDPRQVVEPH